MRQPGWMDRVGYAAVWVMVMVAGALFAALWTGLVLLFMHWPLHSLAVAALLVVGSVALLAFHGRYGYAALPQTGAPAFTLPDRPIELSDLRAALGTATYLELSQMTIDSTNE